MNCKDGDFYDEYVEQALETLISVVEKFSQLRKRMPKKEDIHWLILDHHNEIKYDYATLSDYAEGLSQAIQKLYEGRLE